MVCTHTPVPATVEGLTVNVSDGEIHMCWNTSVGVVSHYAVIVVVDGHTMQCNVSEEELKLQIDELHVSGYHTIEVEVMAVNDAGSGPSATATVEYAADDGVTDNDAMDDDAMDDDAMDDDAMNDDMMDDNAIDNDAIDDDADNNAIDNDNDTGTKPSVTDSKPINRDPQQGK